MTALDVPYSLDSGCTDARKKKEKKDRNLEGSAELEVVEVSVFCTTPYTLNPTPYLLLSLHATHLTLHP